MISKKSKIILSTCLAAVVAVTGFSIPLLAQEGTFKERLISAFGFKSSGSASQKFDFQKEGYKNSYDKIMAEDGFIYGMDYDWFISNDFYGHSIGPNRILDRACTFNERIVYTDMYNIHAMGYNTTNVWLLQQGQGLIFDENSGKVIGIEPLFMENLEKIFQIGREIGLYIVPSILPHGTSSSYVTSLGTPTEVYNKYFQFYWREEYLDAFLENAVKPIAELISEYQDVIPITNIAIENGSNMVDDPEYGLFLNSGQSGTTRENYLNLMKGINETVKAESPTMMTSVEDMGDHHNGFKYNECGIDLIGRNRYNGDGEVAAIENSFIVRPCYIGEFNGGETGFDQFSEEYWGRIKAKFYPNALANGYTGAFYFSYTTGGDPFNLFKGLSTEYDTLHSFAIILSNQVNDLKDTYKGIKREMDTPILLCNKGSNEVYWIGGRGAQEFKIERSYDGGKTFTVLEEKFDIDESQKDLDNGLCRYIDTTVEAGKEFCYRITAYNDEGKSAVSKVNNAAKLFIPENLMKDPSFENITIGNATNEYGKWYNNGAAGVLSTEAARTGTTSFKVDKYAEGVSAHWGGTYQRVRVAPNTSYKLSYWCYKTKQSMMAVKVYAEPLNNKQISANWFNGNGISDEEWVECSLTFTTGDYDTVVIKIENGPRENMSNFAYFDDFELKEIR